MYVVYANIEKKFFSVAGYHLCTSRLEEKHKKTGKTRKNNDGFILFLGFYFVFYQAACGFCTRSTFLPWQATRAGTMTECSRPRRGMTMVASHFNGWVKDVNGKRAFRYATISGGVSRTYGTPAYAKYAIPAIKMAGYPYQMPTASSRGDVFMNTETQRHRVFLLSAEPSISVPLCSILYPLDLWSHLCASRLEEKHKKTGKTRKNNDGFILFLGFYFVFYQAACGFCTILARKRNPRRPERCWAAGIRIPSNRG